MFDGRSLEGRETYSIVQSGVCVCSYMHMRVPGLLRSWKGHCSQRGLRVDNTHSSRSWLTSAGVEERCERSLSQVEL